MNRRAPELALLAGLMLALPVGGFALWATRALTPSVLTAAALLYPFALYAVVHDDDPTTALPARAVGLAGGVAGAVLVLDALATTADPGRLPLQLLRGLFLGLLVALPPAAYATRYGGPGSALPARGALAAAVALGLLLVAAGALAGTAFGAGSGLLVALAGGLYARERGYRPGRNAGLAAVAAGLLLGCALAVLGLTTAAPLASSALAAVVVVLTPGVYYALTVESASFA